MMKIEDPASESPFERKMDKNRTKPTAVRPKNGTRTSIARGSVKRDQLFDFHHLRAAGFRLVQKSSVLSIKRPSWLSGPSSTLIHSHARLRFPLFISGSPMEAPSTSPIPFNHTEEPTAPQASWPWRSIAQDETPARHSNAGSWWLSP